MTVFGNDYPTPDGTCVRDYVHVLDLADAHVLALEAVLRAGPRCTSYNVGGASKGHSVKEVISAAERVTGKKIKVELGTRRAGDPAMLVASSDRIRAELGFEPRRQELREIIDSAWRFMTTAGERR